MQFGDDAPLGDDFDRNPLEYMQNYVKNMNNEIFLSEYHINNLYALLLIGRSSPWDYLKPISSSFKEEVNELIEKRVNEVNFLLEKLSQIYEDKAKKNAFSQIQRLMSIIKAKNKSIYIEKNHTHLHCTCPQIQKKEESTETNQFSSQHPQPQFTHLPNQNTLKDKINQSHQQISEKKVQNLQAQVSEQEQKKCFFHKNEPESEVEVFGLFAGLANLPNLSTLALGNCLDYNSAERYIKFKMTKNYIMTIKNDDPVSFDLTSRLSKIPANTFIHHIFPYFTAWELFRLRGVCKEWLSYVKDSWHSTFKREMYIQLLACEFCKDIEFYYKCIQLRNPFFQKLSLLMHALIEIIEWNTLTEALATNTINFALKRVLLVFLRLLGEDIKMDRINDLTEEVWEEQKSKIPSLKEKVTQFFSNLSGTNMTINELRFLKTNILDHPFLRGDELQTQNKTPLLLLIFIKQLTLQQLIKNHLYFSQQYLLNSKKRLDAISAKMPNRKGFLEGVYKILLLRSFDGMEDDKEEDPSEMPSFHEMMQSIFENKESNKPDFVIKTKNSKTNIFMDKATKFDIIISTVKKIQEPINQKQKEGIEAQTEHPNTEFNIENTEKKEETQNEEKQEQNEENNNEEP